MKIAVKKTIIQNKTNFTLNFKQKVARKDEQILVKKCVLSPVIKETQKVIISKKPLNKFLLDNFVIMTLVRTQVIGKQNFARYPPGIVSP